MSSFFGLDDLVTDRTVEDIKNRTAKGYYHVEDFIRINNYIDALSQQIGVDITPVVFDFGDICWRDKIQTILDNINKLRDAWYVAKDTPPTPIAIAFTYTNANNVEKILQALSEFVVSVKIDKLYSGTFKAGSQIKFRGARK